MEIVHCGLCESKITVLGKQNPAGTGYLTGVIVKCSRCGHVFYMNNVNPDGASFEGAEKVNY